MQVYFSCPVCGQKTLTQEHNYEICSVCGWEDDKLQFENLDLAGGANYFCLNEYRHLYKSGENIEMAEETARNKIN